MTLKIDLDDETAAAFREYCEQRGLKPENVAKAAIADFVINQREMESHYEAFQRMMDGDDRQGGVY